MLLFDTKGYNVSTMPKNLKVLFQLCFLSFQSNNKTCLKFVTLTVLYQMHWRKSGLRKFLSTKNGQICHIIRYVERCEQFSFGGMPPSASILRTIEDICGEDEVKMQQSFNDYDKCSGISKSY
jgi:hypothetical protein